MNEQNRNRTIITRTRRREGALTLAMRYAACALVVLVIAGCERNKTQSSSSDTTPQAKQRAAENPPAADMQPADGAAEQTEAAAGSQESSGPATPETLTSDSYYYPQDRVTKVSLDGEALTIDQAYAALIPALVKFIESAGETEYTRATPVMRPAIHLDTVGGQRHSYMLVVGEPAIRYYSPDNTWNPWLLGDEQLYEDLFQALQALYPRPLPRGD